MSCLTAQAFQKKILPFAITSVISALMQTGYADVTTNSSSDINSNQPTALVNRVNITGGSDWNHITLTDPENIVIFNNTEVAGIQLADLSLDGRQQAAGKGISTGDIFSAGGTWIQYTYSKATQDSKNDVPGYHAKTNGFSIGADNPVEEDQDIEVGIAYTYAEGRVDGKDGLRNNIDTDTHIFSLYSSYIEDDFFFDGRMSYSFGKNKGHRYVDGNQHDAKYDTQSWGVGLTAGYTYPLSYVWSWQPRVAFNYYTIKTSDFSESARDPAQTFLSYDQVKNGKYDIMKLGAGLKLIGDINTNTMVIKPELGLMGYHDFKDEPVAITAHFAAGGESFLIHGARQDGNRYQLDATVNMEIQNNTTIALSYSYQWADNFKVDGLIARVRHEF